MSSVWYVYPKFGKKYYLEVSEHGSKKCAVQNVKKTALLIEFLHVLY